MQHLLKTWTEAVALAVEGAAALVIAAAALEVRMRALGPFVIRPAGPDTTQEEARLRLARWLAVALEFAPAADILRTAIAPGRDEIRPRSRHPLRPAVRSREVFRSGGST